MKIVFPKRNASVAMPGGHQVFVPFGTHWAANDPVVLQHPELFSEDPHTGAYGNPPDDVESASAGPGEKRNLPRGRAA